MFFLLKCRQTIHYRASAVFLNSVHNIIFTQCTGPFQQNFLYPEFCCDSIEMFMHETYNSMRMKTEQYYDNFPSWIVIISSTVSLLIYASGALLLFELWPFFSVLYLLLVLALQYRLLRYHCVNCYYYGKTCAFGLGRISAIFFKKGDSSRFCKAGTSWKIMIPDLIVSLLPVIAGVVVLVQKFNILFFSILVIFLLLTTYGTGFIRSKLACRFCLQNKNGCGAFELFNKR